MMSMKYNLLAIFCMAGVSACASTDSANKRDASKQSAAASVSSIHSEHQTHLQQALREMDPADDGRPPEPVLSADMIQPVAAAQTSTAASAPQLSQRPLAPQNESTSSGSNVDSGPIQTAAGKLILGSKEWVYIPGINLTITASVNQDKVHSALSVTRYETFKRNGEEWVKFKVQHGEITSDEVSLPVLRLVTLDNIDGLQPEVNSWIELGEIKEKLNLVLTDLSDSPFPARLGTDFYQGIAVHDPERHFVQPKIEK